MHRFRTLFSLLTILVSLGCTLDDAASSKANRVAIKDLKPNSLVIANGLSQDFTVVEEYETNPKVMQHVSMDLDDTFGDHACEAANFIETYQSHFYVTCSISNEIHVFSKPGLDLKRIIDLGPNTNPWSSSIIDDMGFVSSFLKSKIIVFDPSPSRSRQRILAEIDLSQLNLQTDPGVTTRAFPEGITAANDLLFVALPNLTQTQFGTLVSGGPGYIAVIDPQNLTALPKLIKSSGRNTVSVYQKNQAYFDQYIFAANAGSYEPGNGGYLGDGSVDQINIRTKEIERTIETGGAPFEMAISLSGIAYVSNGQNGKILRFNAVTGETLPPIDLQKNKCNNFEIPSFTYISSVLVKNQRIYATDFNSNCLFIIDENSGEILHELKTGDGPDAMIFN